MKRLNVTIPDTLDASPYSALIDCSDLDITLAKPEDCPQMLHKRQTDWALIPICDFLNHGGYYSIPYGIICYNSTQSAKTSNALVHSIWAGRAEVATAQIQRTLASSFEIGLETRITRAREWAQENHISLSEAEKYIADSIGFRLDYETILVIEKFAILKSEAKLLPENSVDLIKSRIEPFVEFRKRILDNSKVVNFPANSESTNWSSISRINELLNYKGKQRRLSISDSLLLCRDEVKIPALGLASEARIGTAKVFHGPNSFEDSEVTGDLFLTEKSQTEAIETCDDPVKQTVALIDLALTANWEECLLHLYKIRQIQDETKQFSSILITKTDQQNTHYNAQTLLRLISIIQLFLDNIDTIEIANEAASPTFQGVLLSWG